jgi:hypothetical protein
MEMGTNTEAPLGITQLLVTGHGPLGYTSNPGQPRGPRNPHPHIASERNFGGLIWRNERVLGTGGQTSDDAENSQRRDHVITRVDPSRSVDAGPSFVTVVRRMVVAAARSSRPLCHQTTRTHLHLTVLFHPQLSLKFSQTCLIEIPTTYTSPELCYDDDAR